MINACAAAYEAVPASLAEYLRIEEVVVAVVGVATLGAVVVAVAVAAVVGWWQWRRRRWCFVNNS
jgi:hypothetical protein